jgi:predicted enzyme related to lactoylglutathione lyase
MQYANEETTLCQAGDIQLMKRMRMIRKLAIVSILVQDQDEALRFYTEKLGLEKRADTLFGPGMRWVTVAPKGQKGPEIALAKPDAMLHGTDTLEKHCNQGTTWVFDTDDCHRTYETLLARGVSFISPPTERAYGIEAIFKDPYGNIFSLLEPSPEIQAHLVDYQHSSNLLWVA